ncbi:MAG: carboxylating nicotinate-nucleotide diphosphorylase [Verrucomicrobia bacterium]|nr:carboxylating nicotinate-nucleotide diphosphorylase [Verrucomicrobiota bacterium]
MPPKDKLSREQLLAIVRRALDEDIGVGDITTTAVVPERAKISGRIIASDPCVVAGMPAAEAVFEEIDGDIEFTPIVEEGTSVKAGTALATVAGPARAILGGERAALNFLEWLSGIATLTAAFVAKVAKHKARVMDTRKTSPGLRVLEKYAVRVGGGTSHRMGLHDQFFVKNTHLGVLSGERAERIRKCITQARALNPNIQIEIEVATLDDAKVAVEAGADVLMLDRMPLADIKQTVKIASGKAVIAASGGITLDNAAEIAAAGVDYITVGALTTTARRIRMRLDVAP